MFAILEVPWTWCLMARAESSTWPTIYVPLFVIWHNKHATSTSILALTMSQLKVSWRVVLSNLHYTRSKPDLTKPFIWSLQVCSLFNTLDLSEHLHWIFLCHVKVICNDEVIILKTFTKAYCISVEFSRSR